MEDQENGVSSAWRSRYALPMSCVGLLIFNEQCWITFQHETRLLVECLVSKITILLRNVHYFWSCILLQTPVFTLHWSENMCDKFIESMVNEFGSRLHSCLAVNSALWQANYCEIKIDNHASSVPCDKAAAFELATVSRHEFVLYRNWLHQRTESIMVRVSGLGRTDSFYKQTDETISMTVRVEKLSVSCQG